MYRPRVIPVVQVDDDRLAVKSSRFRKRKYIGDPINAVSIFNSLRVDELILIDIDATKNDRIIPLELMSDIAAEAKMPFSVGGGIRTLDDIRNILCTGAEKVVIGSMGIENPGFISEASDKFGSSSIIACIDVQKNIFGKKMVRTRSGKKGHDMSPVKVAQLMDRMGAGEIIIQSIDNDGMMNGYDLELTDSVSNAVNVPVIALGGAGCLNDMMNVYSKTYVSALASGSLFCFQDRDRGVLVNYPSKAELDCFKALRENEV